MKNKNEMIWVWVTRIFVVIYVTLGGGQQLYFALTEHQVKTNFLFAFLSGCIFIGRIGYGYASGATKTIWVDAYGLLMLWTVAALSFYYNGLH